MNSHSKNWGQKVYFKKLALLFRKDRPIKQK